jgi:hypothetical protein
MAQLKFSLKTNIVKSMFFDMFSNVSRYYYTFGKALPWETVTTIDPDTNLPIVVSSEDIPPTISDTYAYELDVRRDILYTKAINSSDSAIVIRRINWTPGFIYDMYDDYSINRMSYSGASSIDQANFYVLTSDFNVYKCLFNANNSTSIYQPIGTSPEPVLLADGYIWKFMYSVPLYLRNKFLTTSWMPVTTALTNQFYSNGSITSYSIADKGLKYPKNTWGVKRVVVVSGGSGYDIGDIVLTFQPVDGGTGVTATCEVVEVGDTGNIVKVEVTESGSGYSTQPILTASSTQGSGFQWTVEYSYANDAFTTLNVTGDGYNSQNPYTLKQITVTNRGVFSSIPSGDLFTWPAPGTQYGYRPTVSVTFRERSGFPDTFEVDAITVLDEGYGYIRPLVFGSNVFAGPLTAEDSGFDCDLNIDTQKNEVELIPLINSLGEIEAIQISSSGEGYTYANIDIVAKKTILMVPGDPLSLNLVDVSADPNDLGYTQGFTEAQISLNFGIGDIETKQSNVELLAVDGAIPIIMIDNGGTGYSVDTTITIEGDGTGCTATATVANGSIRNVTVTNPGSGYTFANIIVNGTGANAELRAILSPKGGHGKDAVSELYASTLMMTTRISAESAHNIALTNDYRQISILKNVKTYDADTFYKKANGTSAVLLECDINTANTLAYNTFNQYDTLYLQGYQSSEFTLIEKYADAYKYYLIVQLNDNVLLTSGQSLVKGVYPISITTVTSPDFNKYSGEMLYIDNRIKFASTADQTIIVSTLISF